ncbi:Protocadherin Fat 4 [Mizuhopecten yessoensis]|uniref:Protocadherin Fat 4 n=1 Tax=Mizuhopecten yessoensis TaxID=6573 RepID=A0A210QTB9_MIZYE|nr:Protocadherin Fat 4 [Mizuhopecten yessoensis]
MSHAAVQIFWLEPRLTRNSSSGIPIIDIPDSGVEKGDVFHTLNCSLVEIPAECKFFMDLRRTDTNQTELYMKIDLLSNCNFDGKLCNNMQCETGGPFSILFRRIAENIHSIKFKHSSYTIDVPESAVTGTILYKFNASKMIDKTDCYSGTGGSGYVFSVKTHNDTFGVSSSTLHLKSKLDYEKIETYNITVSAVLYEQNDTTEFIINVIDVDDMDPHFIDAPYCLNITENDTSTVNKYLSTTPGIEAEDRDKGEGRQNLTYSIKSGSNGIFDIDNRNGCIQVHRLLFWKKDDPNVYHLTIQATQDNDRDRYSTSGLTVYVIDTNNHRPKFSTNPYYAVIGEHARVGAYVTKVHAEDDDEGIFGETRYKLINDNGLFMIDNQTGVIRVENSTGLDREQHPNITLQVQSIDAEANETGSTTSVEITLLDINDHTPQFSNDTYIFHINSSDTVHVHANDADIGGNGHISYKIIRDNIPGVSINGDNGTIQFTNIHADIQFSVSACDNPAISGSRRCSFVDVKAYLNGTTMGAYVKNMSVAENSPVETVVGSMDIHEATFSIVEHHIPFNIKSDHLVRTTQVFDRENTSTYTFTVKVTGQINSDVTVNVAVLDVNDNSPVFDKSEYVFGFPSGRSPVGNIRATDVDFDENGNVSYSFQHSFVANKYFDIDSRSGEITLSGVTIPSYQSSFQLGVLASDNGDPPMQSFCSVYISRVSVKGNYTVMIATPLEEDDLKNMLSDLKSKIGNILNLTVNAQVSTAIHKRATTTQVPRGILEISAQYKNGTKVLAKDLQREVLLHLSEIEALWAAEVNVPKKVSTDDSNLSQIALIVVAGVMLLATLIAVIILSVKWREFKAREKILRLNDNLTRRSSLYESQEIKVKMDDETSDYNGSLNTQDLESYDNGHRPTGELNSFENPIYKGEDLDETRVKAEAVNEALLSLNDLSNRLEEEDPLAPKPDYEKSEFENGSSLFQNGDSELSDNVINGDLNTYDSMDSVKNTNNNQYENIEFGDDFPVTSGFAGLKIDGKMISSSGEGHDDDVFIEENDDTDEKMTSDNDVIPEEEPDVDYHLKQVRFANRVVNAVTNVAEELKPDKSELVKDTGKEVDSKIDDDDSGDDNDDDDGKVFLVNEDSNNEYENEADFRVDTTNASIRMDEEINSPLDFLKNDENNADAGEDNGTFVFGEEECTSL